MTDSLCKTCGKPPLTGRAGSVTSYFFQHNYCQCQNGVAPKPSLPPAESDGHVCERCGKSRPLDRRVGSFTSFMFKELRCQCPDLPGPGDFRRTHTAQRAAERKRSTQGFRAKANGLVSVDDGVKVAGALKTLPPGTIVGGIFRVLSVIGEGGMGVVYHVEHISLRRHFALKVLAAELVNEQSWLRFKSEARTLAALNHQSLVQVYDLGIDERKLPFYSMDLLEGKNLEEIISERGALPLDYAAAIFLAVLDGLAYAHDHGVVHRDIKPANIFVCAGANSAGNGPSVKILDFGISKLLGADKAQHLTAVGEVFGSPFYMSPEQCSGAEIDARSDIYSVGCALFEALTGYVPFDAPSSVQIALAHQTAPLPALAAVAPAIRFPAALDDVLALALAKERDDRYQSASEMADDIARVLEGSTVAALGARSRGLADGNSNNTIRANLFSGTEYAGPGDVTDGKGKSVTLALCLLAIVGMFAAYSVYWYLAHSEKISAKGAQPLIKSVAALNGFESDAVTAREKKLVRQSDSTPAWQAKLTVVPATETPRGVGTGLDIGGIYAAAGRPVTVGAPTAKVAGKFSQIVKVDNRFYRQFEFPPGISLGHFVIPEARLKTEARGTVRFPADVRLTYMPDTDVSKHLPLMRGFQDGDVYELSLWKHSCNDMVFKAVSIIPGVKHLTLRNSRQLTSASVSSFNNFKDLRIINFELNAISGDILARANCWKKLETLTWPQANTPLPLLRKLAEGSQMEVLELRSSKLTTADYEAISKLKSLKMLELSQNSMTVEDLKLLSSMPEVSILDVRECGLPVESVEIFARFDNLRELQLYSRKTPESFKQVFVRALPKVSIF